MEDDNDIFSESAAAHAVKNVAIECIKRQPFFENRAFEISDIDKRIDEEFEEATGTRAEKSPWRFLIVAIRPLFDLPPTSTKEEPKE